MVATPPDPVQAMKDGIRALLVMAESATDIAHAKRNVYDAYISEGFTEAQALELTKQFGGGAF